MTDEKPTSDKEPPPEAPAGRPNHAQEPAEVREEANMHPVERPHLPAGRVPLGRLALEAAMITFGVLLALSLESWLEHRKLGSLAHEALVHIRIEMTHDVERLRKQMPEQQKVADGLRAFLEELEAGKQPAPPHLALHPAGLSTAAWNSAMATQTLAHMEFGTVQSLAGFYEMQEWLERLENTWLRLITEPQGSTVEAQQQWASTMMNTMLGYLEIEGILLAQAEATLPQLPEK
jgi:hypothetical protein